MNHIRRLLIAGLACFGLFLVAGVPAQLAVDLLPAGVKAGAASGSLWNGEISGLRAGNLSLGRTRWTLRPLALLLGRVEVDLDIVLPGGFARGRAALGLGGRLRLSDATLASPIAPLASLLQLPQLDGQASMSITSLDVAGGWPRAAVGELRVADVPLAMPGAAAVAGAIGSFVLRFDAPEIAGDGLLAGSLQDSGGPLEINGEVQLTPPGNYAIAGVVRPRADAPEQLSQGLVLLGPVDEQGRREFTLSGSF